MKIIKSEKLLKITISRDCTNISISETELCSKIELQLAQALKKFKNYAFAAL